VALDILAMADTAGAPVVLCTCSTLGPGAESAADLTDAAVLRVDRPMVERALDHGPRIVVAAALASTLGPTRALLERAARDRAVTPEVRELLVADAWPLFAAGDRAGYAARIAEVLRREAGDADAVILAQASMAGAADLLPTSASRCWPARASGRRRRWRRGGRAPGSEPGPRLPVRQSKARESGGGTGATRLG
jgi:hypothetical protein